MMKNAFAGENPWISRFQTSLTPQQLGELARIDATPLYELTKDAEQFAEARVRQEMNRIFVPTTQNCHILAELYGIASAHSMRNYADHKSFLANCNSESTPLETTQQIICLCGLAGVGKTQLIAALDRIFPRASNILIDEDYDPFPLISHLRLTLNSTTTDSMLFTMLIAQVTGMDVRKTNASDSERSLRRLLYRNGVSVLAADEFQFLSQGTAANTQVTKLLLRISYLGVPFVYVTNYNLAHKLKARPQQDRQRLLAKPIVLLPESINSPDWLALVIEFHKIAPEFFEFNPTEYASILCTYTAGIGRALRELLLIAFRYAHRKGTVVRIDELTTAYSSTEYSMFREDVEAIQRQEITNQSTSGRKDLCCPFDIPRSERRTAASQLETMRAKNVAKKILEETLNPKERIALRRSSKPKEVQTSANKSEIVQLKKEKRKLSAEELISNANSFRKATALPK